MTAKLEALIGDEWADLTEYMQTGGERALEAIALAPTGRSSAHIWDASVRGGKASGPNRWARAQALRARVLALPQRLEITGGTGNMMVNLCRSGTHQAQLDKRVRTSMRKDAHHPNERLRHYGLKVTLRHDGEPVITGGTARQRACYLRAVDRFMGDGDPIDDAAAQR